MKFLFRFPRPKSHYGKRKGVAYLKPDAPDYVTTKGRNDIDNLMKLVMDAINGIFFEDDGQVCMVMAKKVYSDVPRTTVTIIPGKE